MEMRQLGRTGLQVSVLSFGCGAVGGLMTKGDPKDQERAVARALELGINYFDTAQAYGDGASEINTGRVFAKLKPKALLATKVRLTTEDYGRIGEAVIAGMEGSLKRLGRDHVDMFHFHNRIVERTQDDGLDWRRVVGEVAPAMKKLQQQGKTRFFGITALGETGPLLEVVKSGAFDTGQICYNALNPSAGEALPPNYPAQDYDRLMEKAKAAGMGTIGIRVLAAGALAGTAERHPLATQNVAPIGSAHDFSGDVARTLRFLPMIKEGHVSSFVELAMRFSISQPALSTTLIGLATLDQFEETAAAVLKGPLPPAALKRLAELRAGFSGENR
jgi:L-galactose dehydrogenase/L-glyceraldehyde 3-phosphate reductase